MKIGEISSAFFRIAPHPLSWIKDALYDIFSNIHNRHAADEGSSSPLDIKILVFQHFPCVLPKAFADRSIYTPLWCGASLAKDTIDRLRDDAGTNISNYNPYLNEMTGIFWAAENLSSLGNPQFIGFNHYRRHLEWAHSLISEGTIVATSVTIPQRIGSWLLSVVPSPDIASALNDLTTTLINDGHHDIVDYLKSHIMYARNMFIMDRTTFLRYYAFVRQYIKLFINRIEENKPAFESQPVAQKRLYGYLLEQLTSYWIWREKRTSQSKVITTYVQDYRVDRA